MKIDKNLLILLFTLISILISAVIIEELASETIRFSFILYSIAIIAILCIIFLTIRISIRSSLSLKIISYFLLVSLLPMTFIAFTGQKLIRNSIEKVLNSSVQRIAQQTAMNYDLFIHENLNKVRTEANLPEFTDILLCDKNNIAAFKTQELKIFSILSSLKRHDPIYIQFYALIDKKGNTILDTRGIQNSENYSSEQYFKTPIETGLPYVSDVLHTKNTKKPVIFFSSGVRYKDGSIEGLLLICYDATILQKIMVRNTEKLESSMNIYLIDETNLLLCQNQNDNKNFILLSNIDKTTENDFKRLDKYYEFNQLSVADSNFLQGISSKKDFFEGKINQNDSDKSLYAQISCNYKTWKVVAGYSHSSFRSIQIKQLMLFLLLFLITSIFTISIALILSSKLVRNINSISQFAVNMQKRDYSESVHITSKDEFSVLGKALNEMKISIEAYQKQLNQTNQRLKLLLDTIPDAVILFNDQGLIMDVNKQFSTIFGYKHDDTLNLNVNAIIIESQNNKLMLFSDTDSVKQFEEECVARQKDGTIFPILLRVQRFNFDSIYGYLAVASDITKRKHAENLRVETDYFNEILFTQTSIAKVIMDEEGHYIRCNNRAVELYGYSRMEDVIGKTPTHVSAPFQYDGTESSTLAQQIIKNVIDSWKAKEFEWLHKKPNGELWDGFVNLHPFYYHGKKMLFFTLQDFTLRKKNEETLKQSEEKYRQLFEMESDAIFLIEMSSGRILDVNKASVNLYNYSRDEFITMNVNDLIANPNKSGFSDKHSHLIWHRKRNGDLFPADISKSFFEWKDNLVSIAAIRDISKQVKIEKDLLTAKEKAEEADKLKSSFLANISHEIRTPMNGVMGFAELLLLNKYSDEEISSFAEVIYSSCTQLLNLLNDIINISQIEAGQIKLKYTKTDLLKVITDIYELHKPVAKKKGLEIVVLNDMSSTSPIIDADETKLRQVIGNLLNNAIKFTDQGHITLGYTYKGSEYEFFVKDNGIGINPEDQILIFERFRQAQTGLSRSFGGTGLGLAICKSLVEMMGGKIWVISKLGEGSEFKFTIPSDVEFGVVEKPEQIISPETNNYDFSDKKILIVDDEEINVLYLSNAIKASKASFITAKNGVEAVDIINKGEIVDLILMDMKMPIMDGFEATKIIHKIKPWIPIIAQTAYAMADDKEKAYKLGCSDYLIKPLEYKKLLQVLSKYLIESS